MSTKDRGVTFDMTECQGVEPVFVFDRAVGHFFLNRAMTEYLIRQALQEGRINLHAWQRGMSRARTLAWRMGEDGRLPGLGAQLASTEARAKAA